MNAAEYWKQRFSACQHDYMKLQQSYHENLIRLMETQVKPPIYVLNKECPKCGYLFPAPSSRLPSLSDVSDSDGTWRKLDLLKSIWKSLMKIIRKRKETTSHGPEAESTKTPKD